MSTTQFDLGAMLSAPVQNAVQEIPCEQLRPYHNHKFALYSGERLEDMVESIRENGVLSPIIVQPAGDGYEILIGHNRWNACKLAGLPTVPAIIKPGLTEDEAEIFVVESNVMQRGFDNLRISEQAAVIALRHSEMFSQGKRNDILRELAALEGQTSTLDPVGLKSETAPDVNENIGEQYGLGRTTVVRLIRIHKLIDALKALVDSGELAIRSGVELSFLSESTQALAAECANDCKIDMRIAKKLRDTADSEGHIAPDTVRAIIYGEDTATKPKPKSVKISHNAYTKYFSADTKPKEITETIEKALDFYFANMEGYENE